MSHQSKLLPAENKFHLGNGDDGQHYWITPPELYADLESEFSFDFDPCPHPLPEGFDGLTCEWGQSNYVNPPFGSIIHQGRKKGPTAWARKAIAEHGKGKSVVLVYPIDKWVLMLLKAGAQVRNLGDVRWLSTESGKAGKGTGRHIAAFILRKDMRLLTVLTGAAQILNTVKGEWGESWSEWDQSILDGIALHDRLKQATGDSSSYGLRLAISVLGDMRKEIDAEVSRG